LLRERVILPVTCGRVVFQVKLHRIPREAVVVEDKKCFSIGLCGVGFGRLFQAADPTEKPVDPAHCRSHRPAF
jgi:hypothetical protein